MTRDQLELVFRREGLTRPQVYAAMEAAELYATAQCKAAIDALGYPNPPVHYLADARVACGKANQDLVNTTVRGRVTCGACKQTPAWKKAA